MRRDRVHSARTTSVIPGAGWVHHVGDPVHPGCTTPGAGWVHHPPVQPRCTTVEKVFREDLSEAMNYVDAADGVDVAAGVGA